MKVAAVVCVFVAAAAAAPVPLKAGDAWLDGVVNDDAFIRHINAQNAGWTAGRNEFFDGMTYRQVQNTILGKFEDMEARETFAATARQVTHPGFVPKKEGFDGRVVFADCIHPVRNQGSCGSCWAFGAVESLEDRFCIVAGDHGVLSTQALVSCDRSNAGCGGGNYWNLGWPFLASTGVPDEDCYPYTSGSSGQTGSCSSSCTGSGEWKDHKVSDVIAIRSGKASDIAAEIENGPLEMTFIVYQDFMNYRSGVYRHTSGGQVGAHAMEAIGYGTEDGDDYWLIKNSWGETWGDSGYVKFLRGSDDCRIESASVMTGNPDV